VIATSGIVGESSPPFGRKRKNKEIENEKEKKK